MRLLEVAKRAYGAPPAIPTLVFVFASQAVLMNSGSGTDDSAAVAVGATAAAAATAAEAPAGAAATQATAAAASELCDGLLELCWEKLHMGYWKDVHVVRAAGGVGVGVGA